MFAKFFRRPVVAGLAVALIAAPASWMLVSAQSASGNGNGGGTGADGSLPAETGRDSKQAAKSAEQKQAAAKAEEAKKTAAKQAEQARQAEQAAAVAAAAAAAAPAPVPPPLPPAVTAGWHENVIATVFWVGEAAGADNAGISNAQSAWDGNWETNYGGYDDPDNRNGYYPAGFTPNENPFYFALPYNDLDENGDRKTSAANCPNVGGSISWCKNAWIKIVMGGKAAYAQWQDVGPLGEDDVDYVFGTAQPQNTWGAAAGLDVSPAVRDYLGMDGIDTVSWGFVNASDVPAGPWKNIVTTNPGGW